MQYLLLCCINEEHWAALADTERAAVMRDYRAWIERTEKDGRHLASGQLESAATATTLRRKNGRVVLTDGPFAETKEQLGGYHLLECRDLDEAIALAGDIPTLRVGGTVEVRPLVAGAVS